MADAEKSLKSSSINEIEAVLAEGLSTLTAFKPKVDIKAFAMVENSHDVMMHHVYRMEMLIRVPKWDSEDEVISF